MIQKAVLGCRTALFDFKELCGVAMGAADYIAIAEAFHTIFLANVPVLKMKDINQVRRLIVLIDTLYEHQVKVIVLAESEPVSLLVTTDKSADADKNHGDLLGDATYIQQTHDEVFAFDRTVSRLMEMQSNIYLRQAHKLTGADLLHTFEHEPVSDDMLSEVWDAYDVDRSGTLDRCALLWPSSPVLVPQGTCERLSFFTSCHRFQ